ncbi:RHS repeat domain-containing protein [Paenibacillus sp. 2TAB23]|uniref:RHS repeat domain-containing protein n=1 Tax=Paenibacillus sp. 2TAB23 TaxID=3233004 RepID=UPI003F998928
MKKWHLFIPLLIVLGLYIFPEGATAGVNSSDVNSVMNGLITQQQINQTNKQQFSDQNGTSETIDPSSGKLTLKRTDIHLAGRDGLDLNIGIMYDSNHSFAYMRHYGSSGQMKKFNYFISRYDLGMGWSFQFPSVQLEDGYLYYHRGDGAVYRVNFNATDTLGNFTHLEGYQGKDVKMMQDTQGLFSNGQANSAYYLEYADKKREYFAADGRLLGIVDRYGNTIQFNHIDRHIYDGQTYKVISSIIDTTGRTVNFSYESSLQTGGTQESIIVSVIDPDGLEKQKVKYVKRRSDLLFNGNPDGYVPRLGYIQNQINEKTYFHYSVRPGYFHYDRKSQDSYAGYNSYSLLTQSEYSNSSSRYEYDKTVRNLGPGGFGDEFRVSKRYDQVKKNYNLEGNYNHLDMSYSGDYTGYPTYYNPNNIPESYTYSSTSTVQSISHTNGLSTKNNFSGTGRVMSTETSASNGEKKTVTTTGFHPVFTQRPVSMQSEEYAAGDTPSTSNKLLWDFQYTDWGGISKESQPLPLDKYNDSIIKDKNSISYTYDPIFYFVKTKSWYQKLNATVPLTETYEYYTDGRLKSYQNPKQEVTTYCYETISANNSVTSNCSNASAVLSGKVQYVKETKDLGNGQNAISEVYFDTSTSFAYPSESRTRFTTKNSSGQNITQTIKKTMNYDVGLGLLREEVVGNQKTIYTYDTGGRLVSIQYPAFTNLNGVQYDAYDEYTYTNTFIPSSALAQNAGLHTTMVDNRRKYVQKSNNAQTILSNQKSYYDGFGFLRYDLESNNGVLQVMQYLSDDLIRPVNQVDPMGNTLSVAYDAWGNQKEAIDAYNNLFVSENNLKSRKVTQYFVAAGNVAAYRTNPAQDNLKANYVEQDFDYGGRHVSTRAYKDWPQRQQVIAETFTYDLVGNLVGYIDPNGNMNAEGVTTRYAYDSLNRLVSLKDAINQITRYNYDANGQIIQTTIQGNVMDAPQVLMTNGYTENGLISSKTDPASQVESFSYNNLGLVSQRKDKNGTIFGYQYDEHNRNIVQSVTGGNGSTQQIKNIVGSNGILLDITERHVNGVMTSQMLTEIDHLKRVNKISIQSTGFSAALNLTYDKNNRISTVWSNGGTASFYTNYKFNKLRLEKVQSNGQSVANYTNAVNVSYSYYPNGLVQSITYPTLADGSTLQTDYVYDSLNRMQTMTNKKGMVVLSSTTYSYDNNGNIVTATQMVKDEVTTTRSYTYDKLNRLLTISRSDGSAAIYTYDSKGNRLTLSDTSQTPINLDQESYTYDLFNILTAATTGSNTTSFEYAPDGMRYKKTSGSNVTQYRYNQNSEVISEVDANNQAIANYVRGDRLLVKKEVATAKDYYYLYNGHGDVIQIVDTSGNIVNSYSYDEWGNITQQTEGIANEFKYAGEVYDEETGLYYLRARYYDPSIGRFINEDTYEGEITNPLSLNLYTYVENNPLRYIDPTGHAKSGDINLPESVRNQIVTYTEAWDASNKMLKSLDRSSQYYQMNVSLLKGFQTKLEAEADKIRSNYYQTIANPTQAEVDAAKQAGYLFGKNIDLGAGWTYRKDPGDDGTATQDHIHVNGPNGKHWSQNKDGSMHDKAKNSPGEPPNWVKKDLQKKAKWGWDENKAKLDSNYYDPHYHYYDPQNPNNPYVPVFPVFPRIIII